MDLSTDQRFASEYGSHVFKLKETFEETDIKGNNNLFNSLKTDTNSNHGHDSSSLFQVNSGSANLEVDNSLFSYSSFKKAMDLRTHNRTSADARRTIFEDAEFFAKNYRYKLLPITFEQVDETIIQSEHNYTLSLLNSESELEEDCSRTMDYSQIKEKNYKRRRTKFREGLDQEVAEQETVVDENLPDSAAFSCEPNKGFITEQEQNAPPSSTPPENFSVVQPLDLSTSPVVQENKTEPHSLEHPDSIESENDEVAQLDSDKENMNGIRVTITRPDEEEFYQPCDLFLNDIARLVPWLVEKDCFEIDILDRTCDRYDEHRKNRVYYVISESTWGVFQKTNERVILTNDQSLGQPIQKTEKNERPSFLVFDQFSLAKCLAEYCQEIGGYFEYTCFEEKKGKMEDGEEVVENTEAREEKKEIKEVADEAESTQNLEKKLKATLEISEKTTLEISEKTTLEVSEKTTLEVSEKMTLEISKQTTSEISEEPTSKIIEKTIPEVSEESTSKISEEPTLEISKETTLEVSEKMTLEFSEQTTSEISKQMTSEKSTSKTSEKTTPEVSEETTQEVSEETTPEISEKTATEKSATEISKQTTSEISEEPTSKISEQTATEISKQTTSEISEEPTSKISEKTATEISKQTTSEISEEPTSKVSEKTASEISKQTTSKINEEPTLEISEETNPEISDKTTLESEKITSEIGEEPTSKIIKQTTSEMNEKTTLKISEKTKQNKKTETKRKRVSASEEKAVEKKKPKPDLIQLEVNEKQSEMPMQKPETLKIRKPKKRPKRRKKETEESPKPPVNKSPEQSKPNKPQTRGNSIPAPETSQQSDKPVKRRGRPRRKNLPEEPPSKRAKPVDSVEFKIKTRSKKALEKSEMEKPSQNEKEPVKKRKRAILKEEKGRTNERTINLRSQKNMMTTTTTTTTMAMRTRTRKGTKSGKR